MRPNFASSFRILGDSYSCHRDSQRHVEPRYIGDDVNTDAPRLISSLLGVGHPRQANLVSPTEPHGAK
jgi:hypothetical protein